jgi:hypothetical protein
VAQPGSPLTVCGNAGIGQTILPPGPITRWEITDAQRPYRTATLCNHSWCCLCGELVAEVPVTAAVSALSMSQDGTMLGIAQRGSLDLWQLAQERDRCG